MGYFVPSMGGFRRNPEPGSTPGTRSPDPVSNFTPLLKDAVDK